MTVLVINGTPRLNGQTKILYQFAIDTLRATYPALDVEGFDLSEQRLPLFGYPLSEAEERAISHFRDRIRSARGYLFCTPEYHHSLSGALKNAFDHLDVPDMAGKTAAILTVGGRYGGTHAVSALRQVCGGMRLWCAPTACAIPLEEKSAHKSLGNPLNQRRLKEVLEQLVTGMGRTGSGQS